MPPPGLTTVPPSGHFLNITQAILRLIGKPTAIAATSGDVGVSLPAAEAYGVTNIHSINFTSSSLAWTIPSGALKPGWVYSMAAEVKMTAAWSFFYGIAPWKYTNAAAADTPGAGTVRRRRELISQLTGFTYEGSDTVLNLLATTSLSPTLYALTPPLRGTVTASPTTGTALRDAFAFSTGGWVDLDALSLDPTPPTPIFAAALLLGTSGGASALPDAVVGALLAPGADLWGGNAGGGGSTALANALDLVTAESACGQGQAAPLQPWARLHAVLEPLLGMPVGAMCIAAAGGALQAMAAAAFGAFPPTPPLQFSFRALSGGGLPFSLSPATDLTPSHAISYSAFTRSGPLLALCLKQGLPGVALSPLGSTQPTLALPWFPFAPNASSTPPNTVTLLLLASSPGTGLSGGALSVLQVLPPLSGIDANSALAASNVAGSLLSAVNSNGLVATSPDFVAASVASAAALLATAPSAASFSAPAATPPTKRRNADATAPHALAASSSAPMFSSTASAKAALMQVLLGVANTFSARMPLPSLGGARAEDGSVGLLFSAAAALTQLPSDVNAASANATFSLLRLAALCASPYVATPMSMGALPNGAALAAAAASLPLPVSSGNTALWALANALLASASAASAPANAPALPPPAAVDAANSALAALSTALLRATLPGSPPTSYSSLAAAAAANASFQGDFWDTAARHYLCSSFNASKSGGVSLTVARLQLSRITGSMKNSIVAMGAPLPACGPPPLYSPLPPPQLTLSSAALTQLAFSTAEASAELRLVQWAQSPQQEGIGDGFHSAVYTGAQAGARRAATAPQLQQYASQSPLSSMAYNHLPRFLWSAANLVIGQTLPSAEDLRTPLTKAFYARYPPQAATQADLLPTRGLDSFVVTVGLSGGDAGGAHEDLIIPGAVAAPLLLSFPLRAPSTLPPSPPPPRIHLQPTFPWLMPAPSSILLAPTRPRTHSPGL